MPKYFVTTMCHCVDNDELEGDPPDCDDHWDVSIPLEGFDEDSGQVFRTTDNRGSFAKRADAQAFADALNAKEAAK